MSYWIFHCIFTIPLLLVLLFAVRKDTSFRETRPILGILALLVLAVSYTTPWDSYLIREGVWSYPADRVSGTLFLIPYEEYFFFVIQTFTGCIWTWLLIRKLQPRQISEKVAPSEKLFVACLAAAALAIIAFSSPRLFVPGPYRYLSLVLLWALPVVAIQWIAGWRYLLANRHICLLGIVPLTLYLWFADMCAIRMGIWFFPESNISGMQVVSHLPLEEALFFFCTNTMVVQGYLLFQIMPIGRQRSLA